MHERYRKVVVYVKEKEYLLLRAKLLFLHKSFSQWIREQIDKFLHKDTPQE